MEAREDEILDLPEKDGKKSSYFKLRITATFIMALGLVFRLLHWPFGSLLLAIGLFLWVLWNFIDLFTRKEHRLWHLSYFAGRLLLAVAIGMLYMHELELMRYGIFAAAIAFFIGFISAPRRSGSQP